MELTSSTTSRLELKHTLIRERSEPIKKMLPVCPICGEAIVGVPDMHEAFVTKKNIQGCPPTVGDFINSRYNCVLVHPGKCHQTGQTTEGRRKCAEQIVHYEGRENVTAWLDNFGKMMVSDYSQEAKYLIFEEADALETEQR